MKFHTRSLILILFATILVAGCGNNAPAEQPQEAASGNAQQQEQELIIAGQEIAASLDPVQPLTSSYLRLAGAAEALFQVNSDGQIEPSLAEGAEEMDANTWEIKLRPGVKFWSGASVDAAAVIASLERSKAEDLQAQPFLTDLTFTALDEITIQVKTAGEHLPVPLNLSYYQTVIHNTEASHDTVESMDMTGMYRVVEFTPKQRLVLEINENYWGEAPTISRVVYEEISDGQTRALSALSGRTHVALNIPVTSLPEFTGSDAADIVAAPVANTQTIYLNLNQPQLQDVRVRQALSWAIDREELVLLAAEDQSVPISTWLSSNPDYAEARDAVYDRQNQERAGQLLDEAGWLAGDDGLRAKDGKVLSVRLMTWGGEKALGEVLQNYWSQIGIQAQVQHGDYSLIETARESGDWDASIEAWNTFGDTYTLLAGQYTPEGSANYGSYEDEQTVALLEQMRTETDAEAKRELALQVNTRVAEQAPVIALFPRPYLTAVSSQLQGFKEHFRQFENVVKADLSLGTATAN